MRLTSFFIRVPPLVSGFVCPPILLPWVRVPSTPSMLLSLIVNFVLYVSLRCKKNENKQKRQVRAHLKNVALLEVNWVLA